MCIRDRLRPRPKRRRGSSPPPNEPKLPKLCASFGCQFPGTQHYRSTTCPYEHTNVLKRRSEPRWSEEEGRAFKTRKLLAVYYYHYFHQGPT